MKISRDLRGDDHINNTPNKLYISLIHLKPNYLHYSCPFTDDSLVKIRKSFQKRNGETSQICSITVNKASSRRLVEFSLVCLGLSELASDQR
jgi:glutamyl/glutaminyl-tRNA synthetase